MNQNIWLTILGHFKSLLSSVVRYLQAEANFATLVAASCSRATAPPAAPDGGYNMFNQ